MKNGEQNTASHNCWFSVETVTRPSGTIRRTFTTIGTGKIRVREVRNKRSLTSVDSTYHFHAKSNKPFVVVITTKATGSFVQIDGAISIARCMASDYEVTNIFPDGKMIGNSGGALHYLLGKDGTPISDGYHSLVPTGRGGYFAQLGSGRYHLNSQGKVI